MTHDKTDTTIESTDAEAEASRALAEELLASWDAYHATGNSFSMKHRDGQAPHARFGLVYGLACQAHESARAYLTVIGTVPSMAATPLLRACYEQAITAHWIAQVDDGYRAVTQEYLAQRRKLATGLRSTAIGAFQSHAEQIESTGQVDATLLENLSHSTAGNFLDLCQDLAPGGKEAYTYYRLMSMESHASAMVADQYLRVVDRTEGPMELVPRPAREVDDGWLHLLAASMVWAGRALDFFDSTRARRDYLRSKANELGVPQELKLSQAHYQRMILARKQADEQEKVQQLKCPTCNRALPKNSKVALELTSRP